MSIISLMSEVKLVEGLAPATDAAGRSGKVISLKNTAKAYVVFHITQGNAATIALTLMQAVDVSGTSAKAFANSVPIYTDLANGTSDVFARQPDGVSFTTDAALANKYVVFEVDPTQMDVNGGFDCLYATTGASNVANITEMSYWLAGQRFQSQVANMPSALVN